MEVKLSNESRRGRNEPNWDDRRNALVLKISRRCPVGCNFCCDPADLSRDRLDVTEMKQWIQELARDTPGLIEVIGFTGGEPFVHFQEMLEVSATAKSYGMEVTIITSAVWAKNEEIVLKWLEALRDNGLTRLSVSCDPSHERRVPLEQVKTVIRVADSLGLFGFVVGTFDSPGNSLEEFLGPPSSPRYRYLNKVIAPYGWAKKRNATVEDYDIPHKLSEWGCYRQIGHDILIQPNGDVLPCCSTNNTENPLVFGNLKKGDPLPELVRTICGNFLLRILKHESFEYLRSVTIEHFPESAPLWPRPENTSGPCGYCLKVFQNVQLTHYVYHALKIHEPQYIA